MIGPQEIVIIYLILSTIIIQVYLIRKGASLLLEHVLEVVELKICSYSGVASWIFYTLLIVLWPLLNKGEWCKVSPFSYFYTFFKHPSEILPGFNIAHVIVFLGFGAAYSLINMIITSYLSKTLKLAKIHRIS